jgi:hypothetical protein
MKLLRFGLMAFVTLISISTIKAQTADDIISKHIDAIGGKDLLSKIKSIYFEGAANAMGNDYPSQTTILVGKGFKSQTSVNGMDIIQVITDTSGWAMNPLAGQTEPVALPADLVKKGKASLYVGGEIFNFKDKGFTDSLIGRETFQGVNAYKIKLSQPGTEIIYFIDPTTYYILKTDAKASVEGKDVSNTTTFSNYKKTDFGFVVPYTMGVTNMGYDVTINYSKVEINKDVDPKIFMMPK